MNRKQLLSLPILIAVGLSGTSCSSTPHQDVVEQSVEELQRGFLDLKFGMFIHFNLATYKNTEWVAGYHDPSTFDPGGKIDTDAWADAAVSAGMKY